MEYKWKGGVVYHKCLSPYEDGICDFKTDNEGGTIVVCRECGSTISISEFITEIGNYFVTPTD